MNMQFQYQLKSQFLILRPHSLFSSNTSIPEGTHFCRFNVCSCRDNQRYGRSIHFDYIQNGLSVLIIICLLDAVSCVTTHVTNVLTCMTLMLIRSTCISIRIHMSFFFSAFCVSLIIYMDVQIFFTFSKILRKKIMQCFSLEILSQNRKIKRNFFYKNFNMPNILLWQFQKLVICLLNH